MQRNLLMYILESSFLDTTKNERCGIQQRLVIQIKIHQSERRRQRESEMKQINVKQAEKWLQKLKNEDMQSYKEVTKQLRKYEKTEDELACFRSMNTILLRHCGLTADLNVFMEEGTRMIINRPESEKIKDLMSFIKKTRPEVFDRIIRVINTLSQNASTESADVNEKLKAHIREIIKHDDELRQKTEETLDMTGEQMIAALNLDHLRVAKGTQPPDDFDDEHSKQRAQRPVRREQPRAEKEPILEAKPPRAIPFPSITSTEDERYILNHLERKLEPKVFYTLMKVVRIYHLNIISKQEATDMVSALECEEEIVDFIKEMLDTREADRRKHSVFKPLNDLDFSNCERASPSYVIMPISYPNRCKGRSELFQQFLNQTWVSVPHGSEENFNVRFKNANEHNLLKSEDERYEFDLYMKRLKKCDQLLEKILLPDSALSEEKVLSLVDTVISMGIIQLIYKNATKEQKDELEWHLKTNQAETLKAIKSRVLFQLNEMENIKSIHANRAWLEAAQKNFYKALDLKGFEFKKNEKEKIKSTAFVAELHERASNLQNGGEAKLHLLIPFEDRREFFSVLNSFESSSRTERCNSRKLPAIESYALDDSKNRKFYPVMIMAFQDEQACRKTFSLLLFYIDSYTMGDTEKLKCKLFLQSFLIGYLGWPPAPRVYLNDLFEEEALYAAISSAQASETNLGAWISELLEERVLQEEGPAKDLKTLRTQDECSWSYGYLPEKSETKRVLYGSEQLYSLARFIYTLYERIIKMQEVAESPERLTMFEVLFQASIKAKEGVKFEENLNLIFGKHAYLFSTIYKLCDNLIKSLIAVSNCPITAEANRLSKLQSEEIYLLQLNKFCLNSGLSNQKIVRLTFEETSSVLYVNLLDSVYKVDEQPKELHKKRTELSRGIDIYAQDACWLEGNNGKKRKLNEFVKTNNQEYIFEGSTFKMLNHRQNEDLLNFLGRQSPLAKNLRKEMKRVSKINQMLN